MHTVLVSLASVFQKPQAGLPWRSLRSLVLLLMFAVGGHGAVLVLMNRCHVARRVNRVSHNVSHTISAVDIVQGLVWAGAVI